MKEQYTDVQEEEEAVERNVGGEGGRVSIGAHIYLWVVSASCSLWKDSHTSALLTCVACSSPTAHHPLPTAHHPYTPPTAHRTPHTTHCSALRESLHWKSFVVLCRKIKEFRARFLHQRNPRVSIVLFRVPVLVLVPVPATMKVCRQGWSKKKESINIDLSFIYDNYDSGEAFGGSLTISGKFGCARSGWAAKTLDLLDRSRILP